MCLIPESIKKVTKKKGMGYKIFREKNGKLYGQFSSWYDSVENEFLIKPRPLNKWIPAKDFTPRYLDGMIKAKGYKPYWHIYINLGELKENNLEEIVGCSIYFVEYRKADYEGNSNYYDGESKKRLTTINAQEIKILEKVV